MIADRDFTGALVLTGPTGSGKSALSLELAERLPAEIIALDSMTFYRGLDIGTAKPTLAERARVPHHLIDVLDPQESASVAWWLAESARLCREISARGRRPLFVGGTPMYLKALLQGLFESPAADPALRMRIDDPAASNVDLHARLRAVDAASAARLHPNDRRRVVRALEVFEATGRPISEMQQNWTGATFPNAASYRTIPAVMLDWPRDKLVERIDRRVEQMIGDGWMEECRRLRNMPMSREAKQAVGYAEIFAYLDYSEQEWDLVVERIKVRTRQFAKRQMTWFRKLPVTGVNAQQGDLATRVLAAWQETVD